MEFNFDGLVGPTHNYGGLSWGNVASERHKGRIANPKDAALQGLAKMSTVSSMGVGQAVLPPHMRPSLRVLRSLGFVGSDEDVLVRAWQNAPGLVRMCSSASAMWTANAATIAPSADTHDGRVHITPANLHAMFHRAIEGGETHAILSTLFSDDKHFVVHEPLPGGGQFSDEGAANHTRLWSPEHRAVHLFAWGRSSFATTTTVPRQYPARQSREASEAVARLHQLDPSHVLLAQQHPEGIDAGAFHTDVLAVGNANVLLHHELAFAETSTVCENLRDRLGESFVSWCVPQAMLDVRQAVKSYLFNSQFVDLPDGSRALIAPSACEESAEVLAVIAAWQSDARMRLRTVHFLDLRQSMDNGGGPACLRQRIVLTTEEQRALRGNVLYTPTLHAQLDTWIRRHYRDRLAPDDLGDPALARESMTALDELSQLLQLGSVYEFQH